MPIIRWLFRFITFIIDRNTSAICFKILVMNPDVCSDQCNVFGILRRNIGSITGRQIMECELTGEIIVLADYGPKISLLLKNNGLIIL